MTSHFLYKFLELSFDLMISCIAHPQPIHIHAEYLSGAAKTVVYSVMILREAVIYVTRCRLASIEPLLLDSYGNSLEYNPKGLLYYNFTRPYTVYNMKIRGGGVL